MAILFAFNRLNRGSKPLEVKTSTRTECVQIVTAQRTRHKIIIEPKALFRDPCSVGFSFASKSLLLILYSPCYKYPKRAQKY